MPSQWTRGRGRDHSSGEHDAALDGGMWEAMLKERSSTGAEPTWERLAPFATALPAPTGRFGRAALPVCWGVADGSCSAPLEPNASAGWREAAPSRADGGWLGSGAPLPGHSRVGAIRASSWLAPNYVDWARRCAWRWRVGAWHRQPAAWRRSVGKSRRAVLVVVSADARNLINTRDEFVAGRPTNHTCQFLTVAATLCIAPGVSAGVCVRPCWLSMALSPPLAHQPSPCTWKPHRQQQQRHWKTKPTSNSASPNWQPN